MNINDLASKKVAVLGVGIEGIALVNYLSDKCSDITILDKKDEQSLLQDESSPIYDDLFKILKRPEIKRCLGLDYLKNLHDYDIIFRSPGIKYYSPEIQQAVVSGVEVSSQIKLFFDLCPCRIIGVTGTKGKGTTSSLIFQMLKKKMQIPHYKPGEDENLDTPGPKVYLAGNIGTPAISLLDGLGQEDWVVLELSSFQLQDLRKSPSISVVVNIASDHLDYHSDEDEYRLAKQSIVKYQTENDQAVINMDSLYSYQFAENTAAKTYYFSGNKHVDNGAFVRGRDSDAEVILSLGESEIVICRAADIQLVGHHNLENIAAASLAASLAGVDVETIKTVAKDFRGLPYRLEFVAEINQVRIYNDSFSTNPEPTIAAIRSFADPKVIILGGSSKGADFERLAQEISAAMVRAVVLVGDEAENIKEALNNTYYDGIIIEAGYDLRSATGYALESAHSGDVIIFSPACASFDMFKNYKDRGEKFKSIISAFN